MYRKTWMEIDLDSIYYNIKKIKEICGKKFIAVLKADAYGCGDIQVAKTVIEAGADMIAVSSVDEALILRNEGYDGELLILGTVDTDETDVLIRNNISIAAYSLNWVKKLVANECRGLKIHLKLDTGMNRIGMKTNEEAGSAMKLLQNAGCDIRGIFTHFYCSDSSKELTDAQFERFKEIVMDLDYSFEWIHCDNSDATLYFKDDVSNACRVGISIYGISNVSTELKEPISLYTKIYLSKMVPSGETIGYGATYTTSDDEYICTVPIGYADGFIRANQGRKVYCSGKYGTVVGRVCMDQTMIRFDEKMPEGSTVEIFGEHIPLVKMAEELNTIPYEIICLISGRVTRTYRKNGVLIEESNARFKESQFRD